MDLIIETDIGNDPDDLFAICYLITAGVNIRAILVSPGDADQIAVAKLICDEFGLKIPIGTAGLNKIKPPTSFHRKLLEKYNKPLAEKADGLSSDILDDVLKNYPNCELFIIGPATNIGNYLEKYPNAFKKATMQGGFLPYNLYCPSIKNPKFDDKRFMPTFNLNSDRKAGTTFLNADINRQMVGKNVCHSIVFSKEYDVSKTSSLFKNATDILFEKNNEKKFHDPTAACLMLYPEIGTWFNGKTVKMETGWTTIPGEDKILADINQDLLWQYLLK